jgi:uncharacterized protein with NRDE domain
VCLLIAFSRVRPDEPLVVAANRDELYARPARAMERLAEAPRVVGGRDELAGGTWLAVSELGLVAGLTNLPAPSGRDPSKRSRGELPLLLARAPDARTAVEAFRQAVRPADYNPAWILVGDRDALFYLDLTSAALGVRALEPGLHILENRPLDAPSPKADAVRAALAGIEALPRDQLLARLASVLASHAVPPGVGGGPRPRETEAACVHAGPYGTRSSTLVMVGRVGPPLVRFTDGPPCTTSFSDATALFAEG